MKSQLISNPLASIFSTTSSLSSTQIASQDYLIGLRGIVVLQSFLFVFFQVFLPTAVPDSNNQDGPLYQMILRKSFSVVFVNESLIYSWIIFLSARTIALPFLSNTTREVCASSIFRRGVRLWLPTFVAFSIAVAAFTASDTKYITDFFTRTGNVSAETPMRMRNFLVYFNSLFDIFWINKQYSVQAANKAFPSGTMWIVSVLFQQSYTVYMTMIIVPYTRLSWQLKALIFFILTAFWVQSWAWYSVTGLLVADAVLNMDLQVKSRTGLKIRKCSIPMWPLYAAFVFTGIILQFLFISWKPSMRNNENHGHTGLYTEGLLNEEQDLDQPLARVDNYFFMLGAMLLIETYDMPRRLLRLSPLVALGRRSFSVFLVQPTIVYTVGIKLWLAMDNAGMKNALSTFVSFLACASTVAVTSEVFYRVIDLPSIAGAKAIWSFMIK
ncbi:uncharacterized protein M421DRAFT_60019 [Didymella exigua CBS 183.55]|uniref:Acyltransferase 3 domain-containing protein n=1 Tax=Didymella exigua CBS 183.55 TaxID=1150837 RepID=A0A6A5RRP7_9PLEO|nr:uncharacterized protein M421DRAFT_60019 [Didymella exigua CBS 183.55]KAF1929848.1 hypothetical protein M421DRAFT_60019 [Didymella exigua CBS 183.55]